jgi:signal transduction histidine kinase
MSEPTSGHEPHEPSASSADNVAFAVIMTLAAYLGRENPNFEYPAILWSFVALLLFNLLHFWRSFSELPPSLRNRVTIGGNVVLVTAILWFSGGSESYFWVMYLLPIFSAALASRERGILLTGALAFLCLSGFYADAFRYRFWAQLIELFTKTATLLVAGGVTARVAHRERTSRTQLRKEKAHAARERVKIREQIQHMDRLATMGTLSASITHELKNPLAAIIGFAELARSAKSQEDAMKIVDRINQRAARCIEIINDMLSFARRQKKDGLEAVDLNALVRKCVDLKRYDWFDGKLKVEEAYDEALPPVPAASAELQQVVFNLLTNSEQAIGAKGGFGTISVTTKAGPKTASIRVQDDGPGIPADIIKKIWEPFFTTKPAGIGTGLGLPICKRIIEEHGGTLSADSEPGRYAAFTIEIPLKP